MILKLKIVKIDSNYYDYFRKFDNKVLWLNSNYNQIRCCNFKLLEIKCIDYQK